VVGWGLAAPRGCQAPYLAGALAPRLSHDRLRQVVWSGSRVALEFSGLARMVAGTGGVEPFDGRV
jgi:hypothetical protein